MFEVLARLGHAPLDGFVERSYRGLFVTAGYIGAVADQFMAHIKATLEEGRFPDLG